MAYSIPNTERFVQQIAVGFAEGQMEPVFLSDTSIAPHLIAVFAETVGRQYSRQCSGNILHGSIICLRRQQRFSNFNIEVGNQVENNKSHLRVTLFELVHNLISGRQRAAIQVKAINKVLKLMLR